MASSRPTSSCLAPRPLAVRAVIGVGLGLVAAYAVRAPFHWGGARLDAIFGLWVYDAVATIGMVLCAWRAIHVRADRAVWSLIAIAFVLEVAGNTAYALLVGSGTPWVPSAADAFWVAFYVPMALALTLRVRATGGARGVVLLDVLIAIGALGSLSAAFVIDAILSGSSSLPQLVTTLAYPVGDLVLIALVLHLAAASGWRLGRATTLMAACFAWWAVTDTIYAFQLAHGTYVAGGVLDLGWVGPFALFGLAAWMRRDPPIVPPPPGWRTLAVPAGFGLVALAAMIVYSATARVRIPAVVLGALALVCVIARFVVTFRVYLGVLENTEREASTDSLTGLSNRRALVADLDEAFAGGRRATLVLFDLNGFKTYNDAFGHPAGDSLLTRLGGRLREVGGSAGTAYRMGGDEFCLLLGADSGARERAVTAACAALSERGEGFTITASHGRVAIPAEAGNIAEALGTADRRMYRDKRSVRAPAGEQALRVLLRVQSERHPEVGAHSDGVADLAAEVARRLGLGDESMREIRMAAGLHDIGKAAIPDAILSKPGRLDAEEWAFMRRHTLIGERIIASAEALTGVGKLVRSSHERWDGEGYPDRLAREDIPLGARIISVCDTFDAMLADRPYSAPCDFESVIAELERCAGGQFDPQVIPAFVTVARERSEVAEVRETVVKRTVNPDGQRTTASTAAGEPRDHSLAPR